MLIDEHPSLQQVGQSFFQSHILPDEVLRIIRIGFVIMYNDMNSYIDWSYKPDLAARRAL